MLLILCIFFFCTTVWLLVHVSRTRRLARDLQDALHDQRRFLPASSGPVVKWYGLKGLIEEANDFIERHKLYAEQNTGYSKQIESMFRAVQEVIVIFDGNRVIEFANRSAEQLFHNGLTMKGMRIETALGSLGLLEFLDAVNQEGGVPNNQFRIERDGVALWFEASFTKVRSIHEPLTMSSLLVLHDITRLQTLEVMRREFVANVSHELRTPLTIIKGFAETLVDDDATLAPESRVRFLGKILNNAERLHMLVEDLLTLSRLESKTDHFESVVQPLLPLFEEIYEDYQSRLQEGQLIRLDIAEDLPAIAYDRFRIHQVLDNLVVNVFRYAPDFSQLVLSAHYVETDQAIVCTVTDDGPGIPEADLPHLFERFYRVDKGRSQNRGGTGLGLSITKHIVQLHGGTVWADSKLGEWTRIGFSLPCVVVAESSDDLI